ncbi:MAG: ABC transporter permease [Candidatus Hadarchaeum sp.]|uniref:ABC transporter permease n=1 Tax=Candidatus Hadarchaeum sp. TaxID=2883567 RepID=UPI00317BD334
MKRYIAYLLRKHPSLVIFGLILLFLAVRAPHFATSTNFRVIVTNVTVLAIAAAGLALVMLLGEIDLSLGGTIGLAAALFTGMINQGVMSPSLSAVFVLAFSTLFGTINGVFVMKGYSSFLVTLTTYFIAMGIERIYTHGHSIWLPTAIRAIYKGYFLGIPVPVYFILTTYIPLCVFFAKTRLGLHMRVIGQNRGAARETGVKVGKATLIGFSAAGLFYGSAAILECMRTSGAIAYVGNQFLLPALGAVFFGSSLFGRPHIVGTLLGSLVFSLIGNGLTLLGAPFYLTPLTQGLLVVFVVALTNLSDRSIKQVKFG